MDLGFKFVDVSEDSVFVMIGVVGLSFLVNYFMDYIFFFVLLINKRIFWIIEIIIDCVWVVKIIIYLISKISDNVI